MKPYKDAPNAAIEMSLDPILVGLLEKALVLNRIDIAIESGTYRGQGSTRFIAECMKRVCTPKLFVTIEISFENWLHAKFNMRDHLFVNCLWGCSTGVEEAIKFIENDEMLLNHQNYDDIYIDDIEDPVALYTKELRALIEFFKLEIDELSATKKWLWAGEHVLSGLIDVYKLVRPLIILDSAGGSGYLEFQTVLKQMHDMEYLLLLDDTTHIKHYRSLEHIRKDSSFELLGASKEHGWALAWHG
jgi:hypothetical protein